MGSEALVVLQKWWPSTRRSAAAVVAVVVGCALLGSCTPEPDAGAPTSSPTEGTPAPSSESAEAGLLVTVDSVQNLLIPAGACGSGSGAGWDQPFAIQLSDGSGEHFDDAGKGAGILKTTFVGSSDINRDGVNDAVVMLDCTGTPLADCCAGRTSTLNAAVVLDVSDESPSLNGEPLFGSAVEVAGVDEYREIAEVALIGTQLLVREVFTYPEELDPAVVTTHEGWHKFALTNGSWAGVQG